MDEPTKNSLELPATATSPAAVEAAAAVEESATIEEPAKIVVKTRPPAAKTIIVKPPIASKPVTAPKPERPQKAPSRALPIFVLLVAVGGMFCWRVASTDPKWNAAGDAPQAAKPAPAKVTKPQSAPKASSGVRNPVKQTKHDSVAQETKTATPAKRQPPAASTVSDQPQSTTVAGSLNAYLAAHKGEMVPFTHRGQQRTVKLVAFTDDTVTIQVKTKSLTLKRSDLTPEQLELWK